jgi:hypothetical protein
VGGNGIPNMVEESVVGCFNIHTYCLTCELKDEVIYI